MTISDGRQRPEEAQRIKDKNTVNPLLTEEAEQSTEKGTSLKNRCNVTGNCATIGFIDMEVGHEAVACNGGANEG